MDWNALRNKRTSVSGVSGLPKLQQHQAHVRFPMAANYTTNGEFVVPSGGQNEPRASYYASQHPLFCADWISGQNADLVAVLSFREGFQNRIQVILGHQQPGDGGAFMDESAGESGDREAPSDVFDFNCVAEALVEYPVTRLQWEPKGHERLAASLEVLRLYRYLLEYGEPSLVQTHLLANNSTANSSNGSGINADPNDINAFPPVTSFDWNATDPLIIITLSVDTTCTVWDLTRSRTGSNSVGSGSGITNDTAQVKTQLIAHDLEVFDVKFLHMSTNVFASVSNDGSMRVFDLRSLEHSTIIYEPVNGGIDSAAAAAALSMAQYNPQALLRLLASNVDQHHLATVGVNLNQVLIIDLRMPGVPVMTIDALFEGNNPGAVNLIQWHPSANLMATGGDDCQALVWDCSGRNSLRLLADKVVLDTPVLAFSEDLEVNTVCWRRDAANWLGVVSGKGFQALETH